MPDYKLLSIRVFIIPGNAVKNVDDRLVVLNDIALSVVNDLREKNPSHVFTFRKKPIDHMSNSGWRRARE
jgi:integrase